jgi:hypothetical protein
MNSIEWNREDCRATLGNAIGIGPRAGSMKRDEQRQPNAEDDQRNEEMAVGKDRPCGLEKRHPAPGSRFTTASRQHTDAR